MQWGGKGINLKTPQGADEQQYHFNCKVEMIESTVQALEDTLREEIERIEDRFRVTETAIEKMNKHQKEQLFNLKTEQQTLRQSTRKLSMSPRFRKGQRQVDGLSDSDESDSLKSSMNSLKEADYEDEGSNSDGLIDLLGPALAAQRESEQKAGNSFSSKMASVSPGSRRLTFAERYPRVEGLKPKQIKEYSILGEMGLNDLIPKSFLHHFNRCDEDGNHTMPANYSDFVNAHGFGTQFIDQLRQKKGYAFVQSLKEPATRAKYLQAQINSMCVTIKRGERNIGEIIQDSKVLRTKVEATLTSTTEAMNQISMFRANTQQIETLLSQQKDAIHKFDRRAKNQDIRMENLTKKVDDFTLDFSTKVDRLVKDIGHRFKNFNLVNNQLQNVQTLVNHLMNKTKSKVVQQRQKTVQRQAKLSDLTRTLDTVETAVIGLSSEVEQIKMNSDQIDHKIEKFGNAHINPLIDDMINQTRASKDIVREFHKSIAEKRSIEYQTQQQSLMQSSIMNSDFPQFNDAPSQMILSYSQQQPVIGGATTKSQEPTISSLAKQAKIRVAAQHKQALGPQSFSQMATKYVKEDQDEADLVRKEKLFLGLRKKLNVGKVHANPMNLQKMTTLQGEQVQGLKINFDSAKDDPLSRNSSPEKFKTGADSPMSGALARRPLIQPPTIQSGGAVRPHTQAGTTRNSQRRGRNNFSRLSNRQTIDAAQTQSMSLSQTVAQRFKERKSQGGARNNSSTMVATTAVDGRTTEGMIKEGRSRSIVTQSIDDQLMFSRPMAESVCICESPQAPLMTMNGPPEMRSKSALGQSQPINGATGGRVTGKMTKMTSPSGKHQFGMSSQRYSYLASKKCK